MAEEQDQSGERTEEPTAKRISDAIKKGNVVKSQEVSTWFMLSGAALILFLFAPGFGTDLRDNFFPTIVRAIEEPLSPENTMLISTSTIYWFVGVIVLPFFLLVVMAIIASLVQHPVVLSVDPVKPKFSKVSPLSGLKRLASTESLMNFAKSLVKFAVVSTAMVVVLWPDKEKLDLVTSISLTDTLGIAREEIQKLVLISLFIYFIFAAADFGYQYYNWHKKLKMSLYEVKKEHKEQEGDPLIKSRIRSLRIQRARIRMMAQVPKATAVITNPVHYAVALKYEQGMEAPICLAKGADNVALKIKEIAKKNSVPVVENPPLARALYASVDLDHQIPIEHYKAVAKIIGVILRVRNRKVWKPD